MRPDDVPLWGSGTTGQLGRTLYRGVHVPPDAEIDPAWQMRCALKRAGSGAVIGGVSAAILHGIAWYEEDFEVEVCRNATGQGRCRGGINVVRSDLAPADVTTVDGIPVLSVVRTAYDLGRRPPEWRALGHLDDLLKATGLHSSAEQRAHDEARDAKARRIGWHIIRVRAEQIRDEPHDVVHAIDKLLRERGYRG